MSKRGHENISRAGPVMTGAVAAGAVETGANQPDAKRPKVDEGVKLDQASLAVLIQSASRLNHLVRDLQRYETKDQAQAEPASIQPSVMQALVELSQTLAPALNKLSGIATPRNDLSSLTKFTSADAEAPLLPLPKIIDPDWEALALTHAGTVGVGQEHLSYERAEWMGDAYLEVIASCFIHKTFPFITSGQCAQHREVLVRNQTLAQYTVQFGLDRRAKLPTEFAKDGRPGGTIASSKERTKVHGDLFEAWIGAVIVSDPQHGITRAAEFIKPLWARALQKHIIAEEQRQGREIARIASGDTGRERSPKEELLVILGVKGIKVEYKDIVPKKPKKDADLGLEVFTVGCYLFGWGETGKELGVGTAKSKKDAGQKAAQAALNNKKLMKFYGEKKKAFMEAQAHQAALV
ncbi:ribonuclease III [Thozetella sp. PMI_491]|nr:ribonuclease III [Thozetella sp. PMI_491]